MTRPTKRTKAERPAAGNAGAADIPGTSLVPPVDGRAPGELPRPITPRPRRAPRPAPPLAFDRLTLRHDLTPPRSEWGALVPVAKLGKTWGVHGDITVRLYNPDSEVAWAADVMLLRGDGFPPVAVAIDRWQTKGNAVVLRPEGIDSPQLARALTGLEILVPPEDLPPIEDEDEFYVHELVGMAVVDTERGDLGTIRDVFTAGSSDIWVVQGPHGEILIPAIKQFVLEVDRDQRLVTVRYELE
jgi:16S rRNA processing protein RimM